MIGSTNTMIPHIVHFYNNGDQCINITSGWATKGDLSSFTLNGGSGAIRTDAYTTWGTSSVIINSNEISGGDGGINFIATKSAIDLTDFKKIRFVVSAATSNGSEQRATFYIAPAKNYMGRGTSWSNMIYPLYVNCAPPTPYTVELDVAPFTGSYYIGVSVFQWSGGCNTTITIKAIYGEK